MKTKSRTSLVLMELIITILLFSFCSTVCVQLFVQSYLIDKQTKELNFAMSQAQAFAEVLRGTDGSIEEILQQFPYATSDGSSYIKIFYDKDFNRVNPSSGETNVEYVADVQFEKISKIQNMNVNVSRLSDSESIYSLDVTKYMRERKASGNE